MNRSLNRKSRSELRSGRRDHMCRILFTRRWSRRSRLRLVGLLLLLLPCSMNVPTIAGNVWSVSVSAITSASLRYHWFSRDWHRWPRWLMRFWYDRLGHRADCAQDFKRSSFPRKKKRKSKTGHIHIPADPVLSKRRPLDSRQVKGPEEMLLGNSALPSGGSREILTRWSDDYLILNGPGAVPRIAISAFRARFPSDMSSNRVPGIWRNATTLEPRRRISVGVSSLNLDLRRNYGSVRSWYRRPSELTSPRNVSLVRESIIFFQVYLIFFIIFL